MAQLIKIKSGSSGAAPVSLLTGEPAYSINDNKLYIGNGSSVVRVDAGSYTAECSTAAATGAKTVSCAGFILFKGVEITVKFTVTNTAAVSNLTLNVGGTGAKPIRYRGTYLLSPSTLSKDRVYKFYYGGDYWELIGDLDIDTTVATELALHTGDTDNPHSVTKSQVGLGNVLNVASYSKTESDANLTSAIDNIEIGGRNLIFKPSLWQTLGGFSVNEYTIIDSDGNYYVTARSNTFNLYSGQSYTLSFDVLQVEGDFDAQVIMPPSTNIFRKSVIILGRNVYTFTPSQNYVGAELRFFGTKQTTSLLLEVTNIKLEKGNKATDWTPAPEDVQAEIDLKAPINNPTFTGLVTAPSFIGATGSFSSNVTIGGTLSVTGATTLKSAYVNNQLNFGSSGKWINLFGSANLHDVTAYNLSIKHETPFINFYFNGATNYTSRIIEQTSGVLDVIGAVKIPNTKFLQIGSAKLVYVPSSGDTPGYLKLQHFNDSTPMHLVTTGGQTMYSTGVPAEGGCGGATVILNGVTTENAVFWAPTSSGTQGQHIIFNNGLPTWANFPTTWAWAALTGVPSTFTPSAHTHDDRYYTETEINTLLANKSNWDTAYGWGNHASEGYAAASALSSHTGNTSNPHSVTKSQVGLGSVENTALSTWAGSTAINTLGTIATGTWNATTIAVAKGGTGKTTVAANAMLYASAANTYAEVTTSSFGRGLLNTSSGTVVTGLYASASEGVRQNRQSHSRTIGSVKDALVSQMTSAGSNTGSAVSVNGSIELLAAYWSNDATEVPASSWSTFIRLDDYHNATYGQWLVSAYGDNSIYLVGRSGNAWTLFRKIYTSGNTNTTTVDWSAKNLTLAGTITGATTITASSTIQATTAKLTNLSDGYIPYHVSDAAGLANSPIYTDGTKVAIGTTDPLGYKLYVSGTGYYTSNLSVGGNINISATSTYLYDGVQALKLAKGTDTFYANTFVGYGAGNSSAYRQTAVGYDAGYLNSGANQTALGHSAGYSNTGNYQTALGYSAGRENTGTHQTALGYAAGQSNSGAAQIALGYLAGYLNTGTHQTALGYSAGRENTGDRQTALGYLAGYLNTGHQVTGIGYEATRNNTADNVVAIGYQAGKENAVANQFIVKQANVNAVPLIQGDFSTGNVGIGYTDPGSYRLKVNGSGYFNSNLTIGGTLGVTGASTLSSARITSAIYFGSSGTDYQINSSGSAKLYDTWVYNLSVKHEKPFINFYFGNGSNVTSRIIEQATGVLDVIGSVKIPDSKYLQIGNAKFTYETVGGVGFLKLAHSNDTTPMHLVTTGGQTMYSTGVPATGGGGGAIIQLNDVIYGEGSTAKIYSPTGPGYPGYILKAANPSGFPEWVNISNLLPDASTSVKGVVMLSGSGSATTVAKSDHTHSGVYAAASHGHAMLSGLQINYTDSYSDTHNVLGYSGTSNYDIKLGNDSYKTIINGSPIVLDPFISFTGLVKCTNGTLSIDSNTYSLSSHTHSYLPLSGGTITGNLVVGHATDLNSVRLQTGTMYTMPALGALVAPGVFSIVAGETTSYGLHTWVRSTGDTYLQSGRGDANTAAYNIVLNALGGKVGVGMVPTTSFEVAGVVQASGDYLIKANYGGFGWKNSSNTITNYLYLDDNDGYIHFQLGEGLKVNNDVIFTDGIIYGAVIGNYGVCSTAASTGAKTVTISGFRLATGVQINVKFSNNNYAYPITLNVSNTGAKTVKVYGDSSEQDFIEQIKAGAVIPFVYDGTYWVIPTTPSMY